MVEPAWTGGFAGCERGSSLDDPPERSVVSPLLLPLSLLLQAGPAASAPDPSALRLRSIRLSVAIDYPNEKLTGTARLEVENWTDEPASEASFLLNRLLRFDSIRMAAGPALAFSQEVVAFSDSPKEQVNRAALRLPAPLAPGGRLWLEVSYSGYLVGYTETGSLYIRDRIDPEFTILRADAYAFPVVGVPSWEANRAAHDLDGWNQLDQNAVARAERLLALAAETPKLAAVPLAAYGQERMTDFSYSVGALLFYLLDRAVGPAKFNEMVGGFYQKHKTTGAGSEEFLREAKALGGPRAAAVLRDWYETTRWYQRLSSGESISQMADSYAKIVATRGDLTPAGSAR